MFTRADLLLRESGHAVRLCIWVYIVLWILEGALRKWFFPSLSSYLLFVREPVVIAAYCLAVARGVFPLNVFVIMIGALSLLGMVASLLQHNVSIIITLYGARSYFLHFPLIFLMGNVMNRDDVEKVGRFLLLTAPPMGLLMMMQFISSDTSIWNNGAGGVQGGQMIGALGHARPSGTFSFANGSPIYLALVMAFVIYGFTRPDLYPKWLVWSSLCAVLLGTVVSVSRNAVVSVILVIITFVAMGFLYPKYFRKFIGFGLVVLGVGGILSVLPVFAIGLDSLQSRFQDGGNIGSSIGGRFVGHIVEPWSGLLDVDIFGSGMGRATNAAQLYTGDTTTIIESEWVRTLWELGWMLGSIFLFMRVAIALWLARLAQRDLAVGNALSGLILSAAFINIFMTPLGLTTGQGFITLAGGLCIAAGNVGFAAAPPGSAGPAPGVRARPRGRSLYAERLHGNGGGGTQISGTGPVSGA